MNNDVEKSVPKQTSGRSSSGSVGQAPKPCTIQAIQTLKQPWSSKHRFQWLIFCRSLPSLHFSSLSSHLISVPLSPVPEQDSAALCLIIILLCSDEENFKNIPMIHGGYRSGRKTVKLNMPIRMGLLMCM